MSNENTKPQAAPLEWVEENGVITSKCGVFRIELRHMDNGAAYYACIERGQWFGTQITIEQARDLCQWDRQREFCIMGGFPHEGIAVLWER